MGEVSKGLGEAQLFQFRRAEPSGDDTDTVYGPRGSLGDRTQMVPEFCIHLGTSKSEFGPVADQLQFLRETIVEFAGDSRPFLFL
jgi:hypothetical protein